MTTSRTLALFSAPSARAATVASGTGLVVPASATTLVAHKAMTLRVVEGQAWVTLGEGAVDGSDVFVCAGQTLPVRAGQTVVVEPLGPRPVQYRWTRAVAAAGQAAWWQRASFAGGASSQGAWGDACCA